MVKYRIKYYLPLVAYVGLIISLSSMNQETVAQYAWGIEDFLLHAVEYNVLGVFLIWGILREKPKYELKASYRLAVGVGTLIAMADEYYQSFIPSRYSTVDDVVADVFGLILSVLTFTLLSRIPSFERFRLSA